jgi:histidinol-phosphate/aromatic aminotransferase/cobyric acid decarboxylase-like protein
VVFRTFGKIYGLAGLQMGYAVAPKGMADSLKTQRPWRRAQPQPARAGSRCRQPANACHFCRSSTTFNRIRRMGRNYIWFRQGDANNAILAAVGYNFRRLICWLRLLWR